MADFKPRASLRSKPRATRLPAPLWRMDASFLHSTVASQMEVHARFGGVYPEVASRQHVLSIVPVIEETLQEAHLTLQDLDAIAVTRGPGLAGSLVVGLNAAKGLALGTWITAGGRKSS